jgi:hypothetical protein
MARRARDAPNLRSASVRWHHGRVPLRAATQTLVGRVAELAALRAAVERASSDDAATVLVSGEADVGKSRLVEELVRVAR